MRYPPPPLRGRNECRNVPLAAAAVALGAFLGCGGRTAPLVLDRVASAIDAGRPLDSGGRLDLGARDASDAVDARARVDGGRRAPPVIDVNGDGFEDLVVGADLANRVYVFLGTESGLPESPSQLLSGPRWEYGYRLAVPGDVDGDGYDDLVVGGDGHVFLYLGGSAGIQTAPAFASTRTGSGIPELDGAGDVDGDGHADILVSYTSPCRAELWFATPASSSRIVEVAGVAMLPCGSIGWSGWSAARGAADLDGDGHSDFVYADYLGSRVIVYRGTAGGGEPVTPALTTAAGTEFVRDVDFVGDVDGDGNTDLAVLSDTPRRLFVLWGDGEHFSVASSAAFDLPLDARAGRQVSAAGDVDGDGLADLVVGAPGEIFLLLGARDRVPAVVRYADRRDFGLPVAGIGDVDGDGRPEIAVGALYDEPQEVVLLSTSASRELRVIHRAHGLGDLEFPGERFGISIAGR